MHLKLWNGKLVVQCYNGENCKQGWKGVLLICSIMVSQKVSKSDRTKVTQVGTIADIKMALSKRSKWNFYFNRYWIWVNSQLFIWRRADWDWQSATGRLQIVCGRNTVPSKVKTTPKSLFPSFPSNQWFPIDGLVGRKSGLLVCEAIAGLVRKGWSTTSCARKSIEMVICTGYVKWWCAQLQLIQEAWSARDFSTKRPFILQYILPSGSLTIFN